MLGVVAPKAAGEFVADGAAGGVAVAAGGCEVVSDSAVRLQGGHGASAAAAFQGGEGSSSRADVVSDRVFFCRNCQAVSK